MDRYQIGNEHGLSSHEETFMRALESAHRLAQRDGCLAWVFDRLAHRGKGDTWEVQVDGQIRQTHIREEEA